MTVSGAGVSAVSRHTGDGRSACPLPPMITSARAGSASHRVRRLLGRLPLLLRGTARTPDVLSLTEEHHR